MLFFFKQKTAYEMRISDWSSDVCSSDLARRIDGDGRAHPAGERLTDRHHHRFAIERIAHRPVTASRALENLAENRRRIAVEPIGGGVGPAQPFEPVRRPCEFAAQHAGNPANVGQMVRQLPRSEEQTYE